MHVLQNMFSLQKLFLCTINKSRRKNKIQGRSSTDRWRRHHRSFEQNNQTSVDCRWRPLRLPAWPAHTAASSLQLHC